MKKYLEALPKELYDLIQLAADIASLRRMRAYPVGGFVRDLILARQNFDLDIVVEGDGITFAEDFAGRLSGRLIRHRQFGTATVMPGHHLNPVRAYGSVSGKSEVSNGVKVDVATARKESYPQPASLPVVEFGILKDDLKRRDFTINAMAVEISEHSFGRLIDFFNGRKDLEAKKIRILHDLSFIDDPTRILRAIRFEKRFDFKIEPDTLKLLKAAVKKKMLEKVQPQRLRDELILLLKEPEPIKQVRRTQELVGFNFINRKLSASARILKLISAVGTEINWFNQVHHRRRKLDTWLIYFMALIDSLDLEASKLLCSRLVFRKGEEKRILSLKKAGAKLSKELSRKDILPSEIYDLLTPLSYEVILLIKAKYRKPEIKKHIENYLEVLSDIRINISGHDLHRLGIAPGPHYQKIFSKVLKARLNGLVLTKEEEISMIEKLIIKMEKV